MKHNKAVQRKLLPAVARNVDVANNSTSINEASCTELAYALTEGLRLSNGLDFISLPERLRLIALLSEERPYVLSV